MKESVTYQAILEEGRADEARRILLNLGAKRFGKPSAKYRKTVAAIAEPVVLKGLANRLFDAESWTELRAGLSFRRRCQRHALEFRLQPAFSREAQPSAFQSWDQPKHDTATVAPQTALHPDWLSNVSVLGGTGLMDGIEM